MIFRKLYLRQSCKYEADDTGSLKAIIKTGIQPYEGLEFDHKVTRSYQSQTIDSIMALMICHNVTPVFEDDGTRVLQGSSPD